MRILENEPLSRHTSFRIGGPCRMALPESEAELERLVAENERYFILGAGTDLLAPDEGFDELVIKTAALSRIEVYGERISAGCGASLARIAAEAAKAGLSGFEFAAGIPGSFGGGVYMNAGAYGGEMSQVVTRSRALRQGKPAELSDHGFGYRKSVYSDTGMAMLSAEIKLTRDDPEAIRSRMADLAARRRASQPLELPSAGSVFKRPEGYFAGKLIQDCGLKGARVGGAQVSEKHAGFIVNTGGATADDVKRLVALVQERVFARFGVRLETEIKFM